MTADQSEKLRKWGNHIFTGKLNNLMLDMRCYQWCISAELPIIFSEEWEIRNKSYPLLRNKNTHDPADDISDYFGITSFQAIDLIGSRERPTDREYHANRILALAEEI